MLDSAFSMSYNDLWECKHLFEKVTGCHGIVLMECKGKQRQIQRKEGIKRKLNVDFAQRIFELHRFLRNQLPINVNAGRSDTAFLVMAMPGSKAKSARIACGGDTGLSPKGPLHGRLSLRKPKLGKLRYNPHMANGQKAAPKGRAILPGSMDRAEQLLFALDLETLLAMSTEAIFAKTLDNQIVLWSSGAEFVYGYSRDEMIGKSVTILMPEDRVHEADMISARIAAGERIEGFETLRVTKGGRLLNVSLTISPIRNADGTISGALTIAHDLTQSKEIEQAIKRMEASEQNRSLVLETANRVALNILSQRSGVEALRHIADAARNLVKANYAALGVARQSGKGLAEFVTVGLSHEQEAAIGPRPVGKGILGLLLERSEPLLIDNLGNHPNSVGFPPNHPAMDSFLGVPIRRGDTVIGSLYLTNKEGGGPFTAEDQTAVETLGAHAAVAIYNMQMLSRQRALVSGLINAHEEERRAVAYDLHDGLTQYVMASYAHLETFRRLRQPGKDKQVEQELDRSGQYLKDAVVESRRLVNGLRSLALDDLGLAGAMEQLLSEEKKRAEWIDADLAHNISGVRFDKSLETAVYRIAQEALTNARKHAGTQRVRVLIMVSSPTQDGERPNLTLEVRDWGKGFVTEQQAEEGGFHVGLQSMVERAGLLDGEYSIVSTPGAGTIIRAVFPVLEPESEGD